MFIADGVYHRRVWHSKLTVVFALGFVGCFNPEPPEAGETDVSGSSTGGATSDGTQTTSTGP